MREKNKMAAQSDADERDFVITRVFDAPRELVFKAWTDPKHMAQWWGPHGFTNPVCELNVRPGGAWRIVMRAPDHSLYPAKGVYREIVEGERIVMTVNHSDLSEEWHDNVNPGRDKSKGKPAYEGVTTVTFEEQYGKTKLTVRTRFESAAIRDLLVKIGMSQGWSESLERLTQRLNAVGTADREIFMTRVFDAPRETVFRAWTDPKQVVQWWGPTGFSTTVHEMDVRPGGVWRFIMHGPDGVDYPNEVVYVEVVKPERLVYDHLSAARFRMMVTFTEEGGKTTLTARLVFASAAELEKVVKEFRAGEGLKQTLGRLGEYLGRTAGPG